MSDTDTLHDPERLAACVENLRLSFQMLPEFYNVCHSCALRGSVAMSLFSSWERRDDDTSFQEYVEAFLVSFLQECEDVQNAAQRYDAQTHATTDAPQ